MRKQSGSIATSVDNISAVVERAEKCFESLTCCPARGQYLVRCVVGARSRYSVVGGLGVDDNMSLDPRPSASIR